MSTILPKNFNTIEVSGASFGSITTTNITSNNIIITSGSLIAPNASHTIGNIFSNTQGAYIGSASNGGDARLNIQDFSNRAISFYFSSTKVAGVSYPSASGPFNINVGNNTNQLSLTSNGNIGIGTTSPSYTLDINGNARISGANTTGSTLNFTSDGGGITLFQNAKVYKRIGGGLTFVPHLDVGGFAFRNAADSSNSVFIDGSGNMSVATNLSSGTIVGTTLSTGNIYGSLGTISNFASTNQTTTNIVSTSISIGNIVGTTISTANHYGSIGTISNLASTNQTTTNIIGTNLSSGTLNSQTLSLTETSTFRQYFNASSNDTIVITIPYTKPNVWHSLQLEVIINGIAPNITAGLLGNYLFRGEVWNATQDLRIVRKHSREACVIYAYFSATSNTAGNLIIKINGNDGFTQNVNLGILVVMNSNASGFVFNRGSITTEVSTISDSPYETSISTMFSSNVGIGTTTATPSAVLHVQGDSIITTSLTTGSLFSTNQTTTNIVSTSISTGTIVGTTLSTGNVYSSLGTISNFASTNQTTTNIVASTLVGTTVSVGNVHGSLGTISNMVHTNLSSGTLVGTTLSTGNVYSSLGTISNFASTNQTTTNIVGTNMTISNMNSSTNTIGTLNATGITVSSLLATSSSIGNISAGSINLSGNMNVAGTLTVVNITTTNLTMSNGNAIINNLTSGNIISTNISSNILRLSNDITAAGASWVNADNNAWGSSFTFVKSRTLLASSNGDELGYLNWNGYDTSNTSKRAGYIIINQATSGSNFVSGSLRVNLTNGSGGTKDHLIINGTTDTFQVNSSFFTASGNSNTLGSVITTGGNLGIGTVSPTCRTQIYSTSTVSTLMVGNGTRTAWNTSQINVISNGTIASAIAFERQGFDTGVVGNINGNITLGHQNGSIVFNSGLTDPTSNLGTERMRITTNGNVGIGTTAPAYTLDINGTLEANNSNGIILFASSGNVGIGTTSPTALLYLNSSVSTYNRGTSFYIRTPQAGIVLDSTQSTNGRSWNIWSSASGDTVGAGSLAFFDVGASSYRMVINTSGNVGIGTVSPAFPLDVNGTIRASNISATGTLTNGGFDFILGTNDQSGRGNSGASRALVKEAASTLVVNYAGDFSGGTEVQGNFFRTLGNSNTIGNIITTGGNVGIGTSTPEGRFQVVLPPEVSSGWRNLTFRGTSLWGDGITTYNAAGVYTSGNLYGTIMNVMLCNPHIVSNFGSTAQIRFGRAGGIQTGAWWETGVKTDGSWHIGQSGINNNFIITTGGNTLLNAATPEYFTNRFVVRDDGGGTTAQILIQGTSDTRKTMHIGYDTTNNYAYIDSLYHNVGWTNTIFCRNAGNVGIGTTSPNNKLDIQTEARTGTHATNAPLYITGALGASANGVEIRHSNGTQGIGFGYNSIYATGSTTNQDIGLVPRGTGIVSVTGALTASGDITAFSDIRIKTDVSTIQNPIDKIKNLRGVYYTNTQTNKKGMGVIAQEIEEVIPEVVSNTSEYKSVAYGNLVGLLIESIKELTQKIDTLENEIKTLKA